MPPWERYQQQTPGRGGAPPPAPSRGPWQRYQRKGSPEQPSGEQSFLGEVGEWTGGVAAQIPAGFNERLSQATGALDWLIGGARPESAPPSFTGWVSEALGSERMTPEAQNAPERVAREAGRMLADAAPVYGGLTGLARSGVRFGESVGGRVLNQLLDTIRRSPVSTSGGEVVSALGAGGAGQAAEEYAPGNRPARLAAEIAGGMTPAALSPARLTTAFREGLSPPASPPIPKTRTGKALRAVGTGAKAAAFPAQTAARVAGRAARPFTKTGQTTAAREQAVETLGDAALNAPEARAGIARARDLRREMPGFEPTLGEATGRRSLLTEQRGLERQATGQELEEMARRRSGSEAAVDAFAEGRAPQAQEGADFALQRASRRPQALRERIGGEMEGVEASRRSLAEKIPIIDRAATGERIRGRVEDVRRATSERMSAMARELGLDDADATLPFQRFAQRVETELAPRSVFEDRANMPPVFRQIRDVARRQGTVRPQAGAPTGMVRFADVKALRERVTDDLIDSLSSATPSRKKVRSLVRLRRMIDEDLLSPELFTDPTLSANYRRFRQAYFNDYIVPFERGAMFKVRKRDGTGFYRTTDEKVAKTFLDRESVQQYADLFGRDPEAMDDLRAVVLDDLADSAVRDGVIDPKRFEGWLRKNRELLRSLPKGTLQELVDAGTRDTALRARQAALQARDKLVQDAVLTRRLRSVERGGSTPEQMIDAAVRDPRLMKRLMGSLRGDETARTALRRHIWDRATSLEPEAMLRFMDDHMESLEVAMKPKHLRDLAMIQDARAMLSRTPAPEGAAGAADQFASFEKRFGIKPQSIASRYANVKALRLSGEYVGMELLGRLMRQRQQNVRDALMKEAIYNPDVAEDLANIVTGRLKGPEAAKRINAWLFSLGAEEEAVEPDAAQESVETPPVAEEAPTRGGGEVPPEPAPRPGAAEGPQRQDRTENRALRQQLADSIRSGNENKLPELAGRASRADVIAAAERAGSPALAAIIRDMGSV